MNREKTGKLKLIGMIVGFVALLCVLLVSSIWVHADPNSGEEGGFPVRVVISTWDKNNHSLDVVGCEINPSAS
ncbi:MAG: hypothetical protein J6T47_08755 [Lachnospiraceae bacterium]|nr:hypothetical protein [Lachnospiraceae bacterium]